MSHFHHHPALSTPPRSTLPASATAEALGKIDREAAHLRQELARVNERAAELVAKGVVPFFEAGARESIEKTLKELAAERRSLEGVAEALRRGPR
jgi:hypothetical protein